MSMSLKRFSIKNKVISIALILFMSSAAVADSFGARAINSPAGEKCPDVFIGKPGLCFPVSKKVELLNAIDTEWADCAFQMLLPRQYVNVPSQPSCPTLFNGAEALCFDADNALLLTKILKEGLPKCRLTKSLLQSNQDIIKQKDEIIDAWKKVSTGRDIQNSWMVKSVEASTKRAELLEKIADSSLWKLVVAFIGGAGLAVGISWSLRK